MAWGAETNIMGPPGAPGTPGAPGADSTVPGPKGDKGDTGATGATGAPGADSTVPGPKGDKGDKGDTGATGAASTVPGPTGATGATGAQGPKGDPGATGAQGPAVPLGSAAPLMNGTAAPGVAVTASHEDHRHPTDTAIATGDNLRVLKAGDTMTGALIAPNIYAMTTTTTGTYNFGNTGTKYLSYDGTNFNLTGGPLVINANLTVNAANILAANITSSGNLVGAAIQSGPSATGVYYFGNTGTKYLQYDGTNFNLVGGNLNLGGISASGLVSANGGLNITGDIHANRAGDPTTGIIWFGNASTHYIFWDGTYYQHVNAPVNASNGRLWGASDFALAPQLNTRMPYLTDAVYTAAGIETWPGAVLVAVDGALTFRYRWMQMQAPSQTWVTVSTP